MKRNRCQCGRVRSQSVAWCNKCIEKRTEDIKNQISEINQQLSSGKVLIRDTAFGPYRVDSVSMSNLGIWMDTHPSESRRDDYNRRSFAIHGGDIQNFYNQICT